MSESIINAIKSAIINIGHIYPAAWSIRNFVFSFIGLLTAYITIYLIIGFFTTRKFKKTENKHKYAICIAARNEESVIGNLIESIKNQDYPSELLTIFVVADNCTDATAKIARECGAVCYERFDDIHKTKGFALQHLFKQIDKDYGTESFEGYFIFDADNLLNSDYITRMNEAFDSGEKIITSYRNTKNFNENWLASTYAIHWLRSVRMWHRARSFLRLATNIQGTGFLFANELVRNGWNYTSLTEDRAFTADAVAHGYAISFCYDAVFYDEQPTKLKVALRQRLRWSKGHLMAFSETGPYLLKNIIVGPRYKEDAKDGLINPKVRYHCKSKPDTLKGRLIEQIRFRWASFDTFAQLFPKVVVKLFVWLAVSVILHSFVSYAIGIRGVGLFRVNNAFADILIAIFGDKIIYARPGTQAMLISVLLTLFWNVIRRINSHIKAMAMPIYIFIVEHKRIVKIPFYKKVLFTLTWPTLDAIGRWTTYLALFMKVEWKPIPHTSTVTINQIEKAKKEVTEMSNHKLKLPSGINKRLILRIIILIVPFLLMDIFVRILTSDINYSLPATIAPNILFTIMWIALFIGISLCLKGVLGRIFYGLCFTLFFLLFMTHSVYYSYTGFIFNFTLLESANEGKAYIWDVVKNSNLLTYFKCAIVFIIGVITTIKFPTSKNFKWKQLIIIIVSFVLLHLGTPMLLGKANKSLEWDTWRNPRNVYENFNDSNKNIKICGLYEYSARDFYMTFLKSKDEKNPEETEFLKNEYADKTQHKKNELTGRFKGKNVIFLQLEGIDSWLFNEVDMPNLYGMMDHSFVFDNHYSYYTGGGSTFNSELAVTTSFITPISYTQNAYSFNKNSFPASLPNKLKKQGYRVNAFHMNSGEYYMRELNYKNWGYDNYYSLMDDGNYKDISYQLDRELILNDFFYNKMFEQEEPFMNYIISYTPHTPFSLDSRMGKLLAKKFYGEGAEIPSMTEEETARFFATETDYMIGLLLEALEENDLLEDTIIVAFADHYLYTLNDKTILDKNGKHTENNLINHTPFLIWSKDLSRKHIQKVNSQLDILPTVMNLMGISYSETDYIGRDIFDKDYKGYVFFSDYSWYDGVNYVEYGEVTNNEYADPEYIAKNNELINNLIRRNDLTLKHNFFKK
ncbi:MAG: glycosyltransferase [Ruminococcaceae bacterium]|nr:glycosyltransferase [Oscillospiraceae bacterium]